MDKYLSSDFKERFYWFINNRPQLTQHNNISLIDDSKGLYLSLVNKERLQEILTRVLDEAEFLSDYGIRALSKYHQDHPYVLRANGQEYRVEYEPAESKYGMFGGNSNWRGPVWFPVNYLLIESLEKFHTFWGDNIKVPCSTSSGEKKQMNLQEVAKELTQRLVKIFLKDATSGQRPVYGGSEKFQTDPHWRDLILFYEYFHGDIGAGIGASHQTGWTGLVAELIQRLAKDF